MLKGEILSPAATTMQRLSLQAPPSSQLPGSKLEVLSTHARPTLPDPTKCGWIDDDGNLDRHSLDAVATSTRSCLRIVGLRVCPFLQADKMYVHGK